MFTTEEQMKAVAERTAAKHRLPYEPLLGRGTKVPAEDRIAHALEYIASQLGQINAKLPDKPDSDGGTF